MSLMITPKSQQEFCRFLCADVRFGHLSILNDQCWALGTAIGEPQAVSLLTTYGLRAARMHIFPQFSVEDLVLRDPDKFHSHPVEVFSSASFVNLVFSPFPSLDVEYRLWVPDSQVLVGQVTCINKGDYTRTFEIDWRVHLQPLQGGSPMKHAQTGMNTTLQGDCGGLHPVFYLTGGAVPISTDLPGLGNKLLLIPGAIRQVTWALASLTTLEASIQQARQYSSRSLELEQIRIEMADKRVKVYCEPADGRIRENLQRSQDRAFQLLMPPTRKHAHTTYVNERSPDTGNHPSEDILELQPGWRGQMLPEIYLLSLNLLPGRPDVIKGLLQNFLALQQPNGRIDFRASVNHNLTGHSALPMLSALVSDLHPYLDDDAWLVRIYPQLLAFFKTWVKLDESGGLTLSGLTHPLQLGFNDMRPEANSDLVELWIRLTNPENFLLLSLLYREVTALLQISKQISREEDQSWLETIQDQLKLKAEELLVGNTPVLQAPVHPAIRHQPMVVLTRFDRDGLPWLKHNLEHPGRIYLRIDHQDKLPPDFSCFISGFASGTYVEKKIIARDFQQIGSSHLIIPREFFDFIESIKITKLPAGAAGEIGLVDMVCPGILDLMTLYAGIPAAVKVSKQLRRSRIKAHLVSGGISLFPSPGFNTALLIPSHLSAMIMDGLVRYGKFDLAAQCYKHQYLQNLAQSGSALANLRNCTSMRVEDLVPTRLYLKLHGLMNLSAREIVIAHYDGKQPPVTVQYNQLELTLKHKLTEVRMQSGEVLYLNQPGLNKVELQ